MNEPGVGNTMYWPKDVEEFGIGSSRLDLPW